MRVNVYVDGFNVYYGCIKGTVFKWLDILTLCQFPNVLTDGVGTFSKPTGW